MPPPGAFPKAIGPLLYFRGVEKKTKWGLNCLIVTGSPGHLSELTLMDRLGVIRIKCPATVIDTFTPSGPLPGIDGSMEYTFLSYEIPALTLTAHDQLFYLYIGTTTTRIATFYIPALRRVPNVLVFSCNDTNGPEPRSHMVDFANTWNKAREIHETFGCHIHCMIGLGNQVCCDSVLKLVERWTTDPSQINQPLTPEMKAAVATEYFCRYMIRFNDKAFSSAISTYPALFIPSEHDFFEGFGSHSDKYNTAPFYESIGKIARRFFNLFTLGYGIKSKKIPTGLIKGTQGAMNRVVTLSPRVGIVLFDHRTERKTCESDISKSQMLSPESYQAIEAELENLPPTMHHLLIGLGSPLCYENANVIAGPSQGAAVVPSPSPGALLDLWRQVKPEGIMFGLEKTKEYRTDLKDGYGSDFNKAERNRMLQYLFAFAERKGIRLSFLSGDVQLSCFGEIEAQVNGRRCIAKNWVTSPMANLPVPQQWAAAVATHSDAQQMVILPALQPKTPPEMTGKIVATPLGEAFDRGKATWQDIPLPGDGVIAKRSFLYIQDGLVTYTEEEAAAIARKKDLDAAVARIVSVTKKKGEAPEKKKEKKKTALKASLYVENSIKEVASEFDVYYDTAPRWEPIPEKIPLWKTCCSIQ